MMGMDGIASGWGMATMLTVIVAFWALVILGAVWLARLATKRPTADQTSPSTDARTVLDRRFAEGGIDEDEYRVRTRVLRETDNDDAMMR
jgi:putative membrane protein